MGGERACFFEPVEEVVEILVDAFTIIILIFPVDSLFVIRTASEMEMEILAISIFVMFKSLKWEKHIFII